MEEVVIKRIVCHKAWRKSKAAEDKHTLDATKKKVYATVLAAQVSKYEDMSREGRDFISVCCMKMKLETL